MTKFAAIMALAASTSALKLTDTDIDIGLNDGASIQNYQHGDEFTIDYVENSIDRVGDRTPGDDEYTQPLCAIGGQ